MAELSLRPSLLLSEEYNDNVFLEEKDTSEDYITRVIPSLNFIYNSPRWDWDVNYSFDYLYYARNTIKDIATHIIDASAQLELMKNLLYLNVHDEFRRISIDVTRDYTIESLFVNQSDRNIFTINPNLQFKHWGSMTITAGYIYSDIWYKEDIAFDRQRNIAYAEANISSSPRTSFRAGYRYTKENSDQAIDYFTNEAFLGAEHEYRSGSRIYSTVGNIWAEFEKDKGGESVTHFFWNVGANYTTTRFSSLFETSFEYVENPAGDPLTDTRCHLEVDLGGGRLVQTIFLNFDEYRDAENNDLQTRRYGLGGITTYEVTPRVTGTFDFSIEQYDNETESTETELHIFGLRLAYLIREDFVVSLIDRYAQSKTVGIPQNGYNNNRVIIELRKSL
jgi:hypothetical protein